MVGQRRNGPAHGRRSRPGVTEVQSLSRRNFLRLTSSLASSSLVAAAPRQHGWAASEALRRPLDPHHPTPFEQLHLPRLKMPTVTRNGAHVPLVVEMTHPMTPDHYIQSLHIMNDRDPIPSKGVFHFTPANGQAYLAVQARMHSGTSTVRVVAECNQHGRWVQSRSITIPEGAGGCATTSTTPASRHDLALRPPTIRLPALVARQQLRRGDIIRVQVKIQHPNDTGLAFHNGTWQQVADPFHLTLMQVYYGERLVSRYEMTPAVSDNPFLTFKLRATVAAPIRVVLSDNRGQQFETMQALTFF